MEGSKTYTIDERTTMLRVPDLKPDEEPFDPDREYQIHPKIQQSNHMLRIGGGDDALAKDGAMLSGLAHDGAWKRPASPEESQELQAIRQRNATFDDATVRSALTDLHESGDDFERKLSELPGRQANDIGKFTDSFLKEQRENLASQMTNDQQKRHFELGFGAFSGETLVRSKAMREEKTRSWQSEVTERQNQVFLNRALRTDAVFNDEVQTGFRNMYLLNVDNLHADLPEAERKAKIDAANSDFCKQVLDKRLELDPARMRTMLDAPAVRRVLGDEVMKAYETKAALAVRTDEIGTLSKNWVDSGIEPGEAERMVFKLYPDKNERGFAFEQYQNLREKASREVVTQNLLHIDKTWREVRESGVGDNPRLGVLRHTDPELASHMEKALLDQRKNGGAPAKPDYALLLKLTDDFDPRRSAENLRDRQQLLDVYGKLGGTESPEFSTYLRTFLGKSTPEDASRLDSLRLARDIATADRDGDIPDSDMSKYLHQFSENSRIFMDRNGYKELDYSEKSLLARKTMDDMGWGKADKVEGNNGQTPSSADDLPDVIGPVKTDDGDRQNDKGRQNRLPDAIEGDFNGTGKTAYIYQRDDGTDIVEFPEDAGQNDAAKSERQSTVMEQSVPAKRDPRSVVQRNPMPSGHDSVDVFEREAAVTRQNWERLKAENPSARNVGNIEYFLSPSYRSLLSVDGTNATGDNLKQTAPGEIEFVDNPFKTPEGRKQLDNFEKSGQGGGKLKGAVDWIRGAIKLPSRKDIGFTEATEKGEKVITAGTRALLDPHGNWGTMENIQDPKIVGYLNSFFRNEGEKYGFPSTMQVKPHDNGKSLVYEWKNEDGSKMRMFQSARPSFVFDIQTPGMNYNAQERDWGFVYKDSFAKSPIDKKAKTIFHEFIHQQKQIHEHGVIKYWSKYAIDFITKGYGTMPFEEEARDLDKQFENFIFKRKYQDK